MSSDREQAEKGLYDRLHEGCMDDYSPKEVIAYRTREYAVSQRERVIQLERALREIKEVVHRRQLPITHQIWDIADAALGDH